MLPVPKKCGQGWYPTQKSSKRLPRARRKTNRNANRRVRVYNGHAKYRNNVMSDSALFIQITLDWSVVVQEYCVKDVDSDKI